MLYDILLVTIKFLIDNTVLASRLAFMRLCINHTEYIPSVHAVPWNKESKDL